MTVSRHSGRGFRDKSRIHSQICNAKSKLMWSSVRGGVNFVIGTIRSFDGQHGRNPIFNEMRRDRC